MRKGRLISVVMFGLFSVALLPALGKDDLLFRWDLRLWGGDVALGWKGFRIVSGMDTVLWASIGGGYQPANFFSGADDSAVPVDPDSVKYTNINGDWRFGIAQGILFDSEQERNLLEALLFYRGKYQYYLDPRSLLAGYPDQAGLFQNSILTGLLFDTTREDKVYMTKKGLYSAVTAEFVPAALGNELLGDSSYMRLSAMITGYLPVFSKGQVSIYLGDRLLLDYLFGEEARIPVSARTSFGALTNIPIGKNPLHGLGGSVRGIPDDRFDGFVKMVNNFDVRLHFPGLTLFDLVTPGLMAYFDAGIYDRLARELQLWPAYFSTGAGLVLYALGFDFILYANYFINEGRFSPSLGLAAHF